MLGKDDKTFSNQGSPIRNPLCKTLLKLFFITWAILVSKVYDTGGGQVKLGPWAHVS